jgi:predicted nucleic acid-binding protein
MKYLIDTCIISEFRKPIPEESVLKWFNACDENQIFISSLSIGEIHYGISRLPDGRKKNDLFMWFDQVITTFSGRIIPITDTTCTIWANMRAKAENNGVQLSVIDGLLAATAQEYSLIFVTRNVKDFVITGIQILNPWVEK